ncbi:uncharacterized protein LOC125572231 [Nematostella vectensis]|uniref:uncharacterized protein LOC125572231 n=1 Tax=Nematostella vectensis TaxID=45351 RepID=UPI0020772A4A|nr:uncharacterized protein LOC125572231 [Nematostella vectensis]
MGDRLPQIFLVEGRRSLARATRISHDNWSKGPAFLWTEESEWPENKAAEEDVQGIKSDETTTYIVPSQASTDKEDIVRRFGKISSWHKLKAAVSWIRRLGTKREELQENANGLRPLTVSEVQEAEIKILKIIQEVSFREEIAVLSNQFTAHDNTKIKKSSPLYRLDPSFGNDGLLRVGGRLRKSDELSDECKHPIILPRKGHVTRLIVLDAHRKVAHGGRGMTLNQIRSRWWIPKCNSVVRYNISRCVSCRRLRGKVSEQKMADLPRDRVTLAWPFTFCGVDYFGPYIIKERRKKFKRYGVIFSCMATDTLDTDSCINAIRRFVARRGPIRQIMEFYGKRERTTPRFRRDGRWKIRRSGSMSEASLRRIG